jgi:hypothetical protein
MGVLLSWEVPAGTTRRAGRIGRPDSIRDRLGRHSLEPSDVSHPARWASFRDDAGHADPAADTAAADPGLAAALRLTIWFAQARAARRA